MLQEQKSYVRPECHHVCSECHPANFILYLHPESVILRPLVLNVIPRMANNFLHPADVILRLANVVLSHVLQMSSCDPWSEKSSCLRRMSSCIQQISSFIPKSVILPPLVMKGNGQLISRQLISRHLISRHLISEI